MTEAPGIRDALFLVSRGIPYEKAMSWSPKRRLAIGIMLGEMEGRVWNWGEMRWNEP